MKRALLLCMTLLTIQLEAQIPRATMNIGLEYDNHQGQPTFAPAYTKVNTDVGLYLLNETRYDKYKANMETMVKIEKELNELIKGYEDDIADLRSSYADLIADCKDQTGSSQGTMEHIQEKLTEMEQKMGKTQDDIHTANMALEAAQKKLKKERKKSLWTKILYGAGGVGVGVILGVLVAG